MARITGTTITIEAPRYEVGCGGGIWMVELSDFGSISSVLEWLCSIATGAAEIDSSKGSAMLVRLDPTLPRHAPIVGEMSRSHLVSKIYRGSVTLQPSIIAL
jgi:hypothetical protein